MSVPVMPACVLAIDDSPEVLALLAVRLKPEGIRLVTCTDVDRGLQLATDLEPDLVLLDIDMPESSGIDVCRRLKSDPRTMNVPIIFLTGSTDVQTKVHCFDLGAVDYVTKPFHPAELRARVRAALRMKRAQDMLTRRAQIDALTGLSNRACLDARLAAELPVTIAAERPLSLVMIDLDHFKALNDAYGHPFGDLVLQRVGDLLARSAREGDLAARYGGEELALVLPATPLAGAVSLAERVAEGIRTLVFAPRGERVRVTASFGVADALELLRRVPSVTPASLLEAADQALYAAKHEGRDCVRAAGKPRERGITAVRAA